MDQNQINDQSPVEQKKNSLVGIVITVLLIIVVGFVGYNLINKKIPSTPLVTITPSQQATTIKTTAQANNYFDFNIYKEIAKSNTNNLFVSPMSLSMALTMTANGANGSTLTEMQKVLGLTNVGLNQANQESRDLLLSLNNNHIDGSLRPGAHYANSSMPSSNTNRPALDIANSLWADKGYSFSPEFVSLVKNNFQGESQTLDFKDPKSLATINNWVSGKTNGKIPQILTQLQSKLYLVNAVYFKANWANDFNLLATENGNFYLQSGSTKQVPLMHQGAKYNYYEDKNLQIVTLPYLNSDYSMQVFLPVKGTNIDSFVNNLSAKVYTDYLAKQINKEGEVKLPKFKIEFSGGLLNNLKNIGMTNSMSEQADFSKMSKDPMKIGEVVQKTFINVDENGTEAAAATAIGVATSANMDPAPKPIPFIFTADHPFFFTIENTQTHEIIFMGTVKNP